MFNGLSPLGKARESFNLEKILALNMLFLLIYIHIYIYIYIYTFTYTCISPPFCADFCRTNNLSCLVDDFLILKYDLIRIPDIILVIINLL